MAVNDINLKRQEFFKQRRSEAEQGARASGQEMQDAIARRFAALNATGSGAQIAAMQKGQEQQEQQRRSALQDVAAQELQAEEGDIARQFAAEQGALQRGIQERGLGLQEKAFEHEKATGLKQLDLAERQFQLDKDTTEFNKRLAEISAKQKAPGLLEGLGIGGDFGKVLGIGGLTTSAGSSLGGILGRGSVGNITKSIKKKFKF